MYFFAQRLFHTLLPAIALISGLLALYIVGLAINIEMVSFTFLVGYPIVAGAVILHFRPTGKMWGFGKSILWIIGIALASLLASLFSGLEGVICVTMAAVPILMGTLLGGVIYLTIRRWQNYGQSHLKAIVAPVLAVATVSMISFPAEYYTISNSIEIDAPPATVFAMLKDIPDIEPEEITTRPVHWLGVPKPTHAVWRESAVGTVRYSHWGDGVHFREVITQFEQDRKISWDFEFPEGWVREGIEDQHIKVGGRYFDIISGGYQLEDLGGKTRLTLTTKTYDNSKLGPYAKFWHHFFFEDFHLAILELVRNRVEAGYL
ncbi:polyketide cyclase/dehydrase/lipid transport protein [Maritalea mobilis]|uniref:Polyketide cyclase/dehydrase/lipid transport protein n=2 Tax=Maritalea mobilis TaxID=483324 RepID=A0A4R6VKS8_9HYPH|nr:polyketide cyclase/dehydrase/lipid transport protein [Maritalea mobilis]